MNLKQLAVAGAVAAVCSGAFAQNAVFSDIDLSNGSAGFFSTKWQNGSFTDVFNFVNGPTFADGSASITTATFTLNFKDINFTSAKLNGMALDLTPNGKSEGGVVFFAGLAGPFSLEVKGTAVGVSRTATGTYSGTLEVTPVPEPETYALMLAGLGAIGFMASRRKKV